MATHRNSEETHSNSSHPNPDGMDIAALKISLDAYKEELTDDKREERFRYLLDNVPKRSNSTMERKMVDTAMETMEVAWIS